MVHLKHFNMISSEDIHVEGPHFLVVYLRMELLETSSEQIICGFRNELGEHQIMCIMFQILRAVCCIHTACVRHRGRQTGRLCGNGHSRLGRPPQSRQSGGRSPQSLRLGPAHCRCDCAPQSWHG
jgi:hypothetical protein